MTHALVPPRHTRRLVRLLPMAALLALPLLTPGVHGAAADSPAAPTDPASAMYRLEDVYNRLDTGAAGAKRSGAFEEPVAGPAATGHTLDQVMGKAPAVDNASGAGPADVRQGKTYWGLTSGQWGLRTGSASTAPVPKTGQTTSYATGDDGDLEKGSPLPTPRFVDNGNGTVTDNLTGLIWLKNANAFGTQTWANALTSCATLNSGESGLTDGSVEGQWRLPNVRELHSLIDFARADPAVPAGHPFTGLVSVYYWSSTTVGHITDRAWDVHFGYGGVGEVVKTDSTYVWPVRGGE